MMGVKCEARWCWNEYVCTGMKCVGVGMNMCAGVKCESGWCWNVYGGKV